MNFRAPGGKADIRTRERPDLFTDEETESFLRDYFRDTGHLEEYESGEFFMTEEMEDAISVIVIATGFPTTDSYSPSAKKDEKKAPSPFQYGAPVRQEPNRFGGVSRPQSQVQPKPQPSFNPFAPTPAPQPRQEEAPIFPNANTTVPQQPSRPEPKPQPSTSGDSDDSYMDIISLFNNK